MKLNFGTRDAVLCAAIQTYYDRLNEKYPGKIFVFYDDTENPDVVEQVTAAIKKTGLTAKHEFIHVNMVPDIIRPAIVPPPDNVIALKDFRIKGFYCYVDPEITLMQGQFIDSELLTTILAPGKIGPLDLVLLGGFMNILKKCDVEAFKRAYHDIFEKETERLDTCVKILEENDVAEVVQKAESDLDLLTTAYFQTPNTRQFILVKDGKHE